ncbi:MAG: tetratricopeptide repeat protein, partial [Planctomycetota bacterium]
MPLDWKDVISEKPRSKRKRSKLAPVLIGVAALGVVGVASSYIFGRGAAPGEAIGPETPAIGTETPEGGESAPPSMPTIDIELYSKETRLTGVELLAKGELDEGERWLRNYLTAPDGREDQALYTLGRLCAHKDELRNAEQFFTRLVSEREDSLRAGDALYEIGKLLADRKTPGEPERSFRRAVKYYGQSRGGRAAARWLADDLYEKHVLREIRRSEWERVRDLYSIALPGLEGGSAGRAELIERLAKLNEWVVFTPYARPKKGYPSNVTFHEVKRGDFLGGIAKRY